MSDVLSADAVAQELTSRIGVPVRVIQSASGSGFIIWSVKQGAIFARNVDSFDMNEATRVLQGGVWHE